MKKESKDKTLCFLLMVDEAAEEEIEENLDVYFDEHFVPDRSWEYCTVNYDGKEDLEKLFKKHGFVMAIIDADLKILTEQGVKCGYQVAWEILPMDPKLRVMIMTSKSIPGHEKSACVEIYKRTKIYRKNENCSYCDLHCFTWEMKELFDDLQIINNLAPPRKDTCFVIQY